jgi:quercetin dioxygenase-like cupin family protein
MNTAALRFAACAALVGALVGVGLDRALIAQQAPVTRTALLTTNDPAGATHEVTLAEVTIAPGGATGRHRHPGIEVGFVVEGQVTIEEDGGRTLDLGPRQAFTTSVIHNASNPGSLPARLVVAYVVEKGKPLAEAIR